MTAQTLRSTKLKKKKRFIFVRNMTLLVLFVVTLVVGFAYALNTGVLRIQQVEISGVSPVLAEKIEQNINASLSGTYFGVIPKKNVLLYPKSSLVASVVDSFPRVAEVHSELDIFTTQTLYIRAKERREYALWCQDTSDEAPCYYVDTQGFVFAPAPQYSDGVIFTYYGGIEGDPLEQQFREPRVFQRLGTFVRAYEKHPHFDNTPPVGLRAVAGDYELLLKGGARIIFAEDADFSEVFLNLTATIDEGVFSLDEIEYVDVRLPDKIFYKTFDRQEKES